jgi:hypothetical protein
MTRYLHPIEVKSPRQRRHLHDSASTYYHRQRDSARTSRNGLIININNICDVGCGSIFSMNTTMGMKITCEMLTNSPAVPLLPMQQISTLWIFATPHTCARSRRPQNSLQSTNSQWNDRLYLIFRIEITRSQQSGERKILQIETKWNI